MAGLVPVYIDRVKDTSSTTGTGTITVSGTPPTGFQSFSLVGNGNVCPIVIYSADLSQWEVQNVSTYSSNTLTRGTPAASSNGGALVNFTLALTVELVSPAAFFNYAANANPGAVALAMIGGM